MKDNKRGKLIVNLYLIINMNLFQQLNGTFSYRSKLTGFAITTGLRSFNL